MFLLNGAPFESTSDDSTMHVDSTSAAAATAMAVADDSRMRADFTHGALLTHSVGEDIAVDWKYDYRYERFYRTDA